MRAQVSDEKRNAVDAAIRNWRQGDYVLGKQWFVYRLDLAIPLTEAAMEAAKQGADLAETEVRGLVIVSQTCDIVRSCIDRPYVEVAPLVEVDAEALATIERGRRPRYAFVPGLADSFLVADLDRVMTVEKALLVRWNRVPGCETDQDARNFAQALARKRTRFAFPDDFTRFASKLQNRLQDKHDKRSGEGDALRALREIRVRAAPSWDHDVVDVFFWFIRNGEDRSFMARAQSGDQFLEAWLRLVPASGRFKPVNGVVITLDDLTARDYVESDPLDLDHLSTRPG